MKIFQHLHFHSLQAAFFQLRLLLIPLTLVMISGCGFHLPADDRLSDNCPELIFAGDDNDLFYKILEERLLLSGVKVTAVTAGSYAAYLNGPVPVLSCGPLVSNSKVLSVAGNAQNLEYTYKTSVTCNLFVKGHRTYPINNTLNRSFLNRSGVTISTDAEKSAILEESARNHAAMTLIRLGNVWSVLPKLRDNNAASDKSETGIRAVVDPTSATPREMSLEEASQLPEMQNFSPEHNNSEVSP